nr:chromosome segregation in meiosis protein 3 [Quercus suber]
MPAATSPSRHESHAERRSHEYDDAVDDFFRDIPMNTTTDQVEPVKDVDEEVKIRKKRTPVPKLDETLLLSEKGIPRLRKVAKTRLKFKGKGHEFNDMARLLNTYQLWLDDMYPRAKFRDGLTMVEKLGHGKRMQITRRGWIDETKPNRNEDAPVQESDKHMNDELLDDYIAPQSGPGLGPSDEDGHDIPDEEDLDALLRDSASHPVARPTQKQQGPFQDDSDDNDDLAALMAGSETSKRTSAAQTSKQPVPFMVADNDEDQDDLDAIMAEQEELSSSNHLRSSKAREDPLAEDDQDDLDALLAEQEITRMEDVTQPIHASGTHNFF